MVLFKLSASTLANIIKTISGGCCSSLLACSTLCRASKIAGAGREIGKLSRDWTRELGWQVSQHLLSPVDFTCTFYFGIERVTRDSQRKNYTYIAHCTALSLADNPALLSSVYLHLDWTRSAFLSPLPASATCMCCSHVAQSAPASQTRCTQ
jgi:hypothetical protein